MVPTEAEVKAAFAVIEQAEAHINKLLNDAGLTGAAARMWNGQYGPQVRLQATRRVFKNHNGKRNLESISVFYRNATGIIDDVGAWLMHRG